jgi:O-antigen ligase
MTAKKQAAQKVPFTLAAFWMTLYFIANLSAQFMPIHSMSGVLFYASMVLGALIILSKASIIFKKLYSQYSIAFWFCAILIFYQLTVGLTIDNDSKAIEYTIAKPISLLATVYFVMVSDATQLKRVLKIFAIVAGGMILYGIIFNPHPVVDDTDTTVAAYRQLFGFGNPNSLGAIGAIVFGIAFLIGDMKKYLRYALIAIGLYAVLKSGSRGAMGICMVAFLIQYGLSQRMIIYFIGTVAIFTVYSRFSGTRFSGIERMTEATENESMFEGRANERAAAIFMIHESPWVGNGVYCAQSEGAKAISLLGSHNFYLDMLKWYGLPLGLLLLASMIIPLLKILRFYFKNKDGLTKCALFISVSVPIAANFEAYIWGVNQMITSAFFVGACIMQKLYYQDHHKPIKKTSIQDETLSLSGPVK